MAERIHQMVEKLGSLTLTGIKKTFPAQNEEEQTIIALEKITADILPGEFISLVGPSGCGKSTCLRLLAGLTLPDEGEILLDQEHVKGPGSDRGLVFQDPTLFPWLTIQDNIAFGLKLTRHKNEIADQLA